MTHTSRHGKSEPSASHRFLQFPPCSFPFLVFFSFQVMDPRTRMILFKLLNQGFLQQIDGCLSTGKEANVYYAVGGEVRSDGKRGRDKFVIHGINRTRHSFLQRGGSQPLCRV